jgi:hypothetical protein
VDVVVVTGLQCPFAEASFAQATGKQTTPAALREHQK